MTADTPKPRPTPAEEAQARAYMYGVIYGFGILIEEWFGWPNGTASHSDGEGNRLIYTGDELHLFDAVIPCRVHGKHRVGVTYAHDFAKARADTAACSAKAPAPPKPAGDTPTMQINAPTLKPPVKPTPLWLITRAADTPGKDRQKPA